MGHEIQLAEMMKDIKIKPYEHHTKFFETDLHGNIHHFCYINWIENARMDLFEQIGLGNKQLENLELTSPTLSEYVEHLSEVKFDSTVVITTRMISFDGHRMELAYRIFDKDTSEEKAIAKTTHCFVDKAGIPICVTRIYPELETTAFEFSD